MRKILLIALSLGLALSAPNASADPTPGIYNSPSLGGVMLEGRATNSWMMPNNAADGLNDVWNTMSWDGATLGTEWSFQCAVSPTTHAVVDSRDGNGTGQVVVTAVYQGGTFLLSKNGPWGNGSTDEPGTLNGTTIITTLQYVNNVLFSGRENIQSSGTFDNGGCYLTFLLTNGIRLGDTSTGTKPADYPGFLDTGCQPTRTDGSWSDIVDVSMLIDCPVSVRDTSWGRVKAEYR